MVKNQNKMLIVAVVACLLTAGLVSAAYLMSSNHLTGTSTAKATLTLSGNTTAPSYIGDTFTLTAHVSDNTAGVMVTFYDGGLAIGTASTDGSGNAVLHYIENNLIWDIWAEANHP